MSVSARVCLCLPAWLLGQECTWAFACSIPEVHEAVNGLIGMCRCRSRVSALIKTGAFEKFWICLRPPPPATPAKCRGRSWEERRHTVSILVLSQLSQKPETVVEARDGNLVQRRRQKGVCFAPGSACLADCHSRRLSLPRGAHLPMVRGRAAACDLKRKEGGLAEGRKGTQDTRRQSTSPLFQAPAGSPMTLQGADRTDTDSNPLAAIQFAPTHTGVRGSPHS